MTRYHRKIIRIRASDSPNVKYGLRYYELHGRTNETLAHVHKHGELIPGLVNCSQYLQSRALLPKGLQSIQLDAEFPQGSEDWMYPGEWILKCEESWINLGGNVGPAEAIGVDAAEGGDNTAIAVVAQRGLKCLIGKKTPDTSVIGDLVIATTREYSVRPEKVFFDAGGGGTQHVHYLRKRGFNVQTVKFGEAVTQPPRRRGQLITRAQKVEEREQRYLYKNRRAQLYHGLRLRMDPAAGDVFAIDPEVLDRRRLDGGPSLRAQMRPIPMWYDEGKICLPRKSGKPGTRDADQTTLVKLIGCSPDELEAVLLGVYGLGQRAPRKISLVGH